jgi:hypothetical protein
VAAWPWEKRLTYQQSIAAKNRHEQRIIEEEQQAAQSGNLGSPSRSTDSIDRTTTAGVEQHETVIST